MPLVLLFCTAPVRANDTAGSAGMATVERRPFVKFVTLTGELEASDSLIVYAPRIPHHWNLKLSHLADQGSAVRKGELLVKFDGSSLETERLDLEKKREEARLKIARKEAEIGSQRQEQLLQQATAEKELKVARIFADIPPDLIPHEDSEKYRYDVSQAGIKLDKAEQQLASQKETGQAELEVLQLDYQRADLQLNQLLQAIDRLTVRAPTPGLAIRARHLREQRRVQPGDPIRGGRPVMMLPNLDRLEVAAVVYDSELGLLQEGIAYRGGPGRLSFPPLPRTGAAGLGSGEVQVVEIAAQGLRGPGVPAGDGSGHHEAGNDGSSEDSGSRGRAADGAPGGASPGARW